MPFQVRLLSSALVPGGADCACTTPAAANDAAAIRQARIGDIFQFLWLIKPMQRPNVTQPESGSGTVAELQPLDPDKQGCQLCFSRMTLGLQKRAVWIPGHVRGACFRVLPSENFCAELASLLGAKLLHINTLNATS